jgi:hypothetical protein
MGLGKRCSDNQWLAYWGSKGPTKVRSGLEPCSKKNTFPPIRWFLGTWQKELKDVHWQNTSHRITDHIQFVPPAARPTRNGGGMAVSSVASGP